MVSRNKDGSTPLRELRQRLQRAAGEFVAAHLARGEVAFQGELRWEWLQLRNSVLAVIEAENKVYGPPKGEGGV